MAWALTAALAAALAATLAAAPVHAATATAPVTPSASSPALRGNGPATASKASVIPPTATPAVTGNAAPSTAAAPGTVTRVFKLSDFGAPASIEFRGIDHSIYLPLSVRLDESVVRARLKLRVTFSPALLADLSHFRVAVHEETLATIPAVKAKLGQPQEVEIELDPRHFTEYAKLRLQFIGHYTLDCEYPFHSSLWAQVSGGSTLELVTRPLPLQDDLALLPAPFVDVRDASRVQLPFVFAAKPGPAIARSAAVLASWFGATAGWRGAQFPVLFDELPKGHAVVMATNDAVPAGLDLPRVEQPTLLMRSHPRNPTAKLLVLMGRDAEQLATATHALVLGQAVLSGASTTVKAVDLPAPRRAYEAPNVQEGGKLVRLGDLQRRPGGLEVSGSRLDTVSVPLRLAADSFTWESRGLPVFLRYRYTAPAEQGSARLSVLINDRLVQAFPLRAADRRPAGAGDKVLLPFLDTGGAVDKQDFTVPAFHLGASNLLQFRFDIAPSEESRCRNTLLAQQAAIDPDSTIDLRDVEHYAQLPNLAMYANSGFPFTRLADLAETAVVLPDAPTASDLQTALTAVGQLSAATGAVALRLAVAPASQVEKVADRDLLVVAGSNPSPALLAWQANLPVTLAKAGRGSSPLTFFSDLGAEWFGGAPSRRSHAQGAAKLLEGGSLGLVMGLESPLRSGRSAVVLQASDEAAAVRLREALLDPGKLAKLQGDLSVLRGEQIDAFRVGSTYEVGSLSWWRWAWFQIHERPLLLVLLAALMGVLVALPLYRSLRQRAQRRMQA